MTEQSTLRPAQLVGAPTVVGESPSPSKPDEAFHRIEVSPSLLGADLYQDFHRCFQLHLRKFLRSFDEEICRDEEQAVWAWHRLVTGWVPMLEEIYVQMTREAIRDSTSFTFRDRRAITDGVNQRAQAWKFILSQLRRRGVSPEFRYAECYRVLEFLCEVPADDRLQLHQVSDDVESAWTHFFMESSRLTTECQKAIEDELPAGNAGCLRQVKEKRERASMLRKICISSRTGFIVSELIRLLNDECQRLTETFLNLDDSVTCKKEFVRCGEQTERFREFHSNRLRQDDLNQYLRSEAIPPETRESRMLQSIGKRSTQAAR